MRSSSTSPRGTMLPRYNKHKATAAKKSDKKNMTHLEFLAFIEPFYELVKEKNMDDLKRQTAPKSFSIKKEIYAKLNEQLKERLCGSFIFNQDVEIADFQTESEMVIKKPIRTHNIFNSLFEKHDILKKYQSLAYKSMYQEYENQVAINNARRLAIVELIEDRIKYQAYAYAYDLVNHEIEEVYKRIKARKKKSPCEIDTACAKEYLNRIKEFQDLFGTFEQFSDNELIYSDRFVADCQENGCL